MPQQRPGALRAVAQPQRIGADRSRRQRQRRCRHHRREPPPGERIQYPRGNRNAARPGRHVSTGAHGEAHVGGWGQGAGSSSSSSRRRGGQRPHGVARTFHDAAQINAAAGGGIEPNGGLPGGVVDLSGAPARRLAEGPLHEIGARRARHPFDRERSGRGECRRGVRVIHRRAAEVGGRKPSSASC